MQFETLFAQGIPDMTRERLESGVRNSRKGLIENEKRARCGFSRGKSLESWKNNPRFQFACGQPMRQRTDQFLFMFHRQPDSRTRSVRQENPWMPMKKPRSLLPDLI